MRTCWDIPTARIHRILDLAVNPDRQRPGYFDWRVWRTVCGQNIALTGHPKDRPPTLTRCEVCFA